MEYQLPLPFIVIATAWMLLRNRHDIFHPGCVLHALYAIVFGASIFISNDGFISAQRAPEIWLYLSGFTLLILLALLPSWFLGRPDLQVYYWLAGSVRPVLWIMALLGFYGFIFFAPYVIQSISVDAFLFRELRAVSIIPPSLFLTLAAVPATFLSVYGLVLFSPLVEGAGRFVKTGLLAGFLCYAMNVLCNKGRDWVVQYGFLMIFYYWIFNKSWRQYQKKLIVGLGGLLLVFALLYIAVVTFQRFGDTGGRGIAAGSIEYLGQQVYFFVKTVTEEDFSWESTRMIFPVFYSLFDSGAPSVDEHLAARTMEHQWSFSTFLGTFFPVGGWLGLGILVVSINLIFLLGFRRFSAREDSHRLSALALLYYQFMFMGAFSWHMYGRAWNVFIIFMLALVVLAPSFRGGANRLAVRHGPRFRG